MTALLAGLGSALVISACGGSAPGNGITIISGSIAYFVVRNTSNQDTASVLAGNTVQLQGTTYDGGFNALALVGDTAWVSRDTTVAKVDAHGLVTTIVPGSTWVLGSFTPKGSQTAYSDSVLINALGPN
ncbi:MAG TPA: Ig-like domain-containing protein [Gemmatimonadaceae bacterium]